MNQCKRITLLSFGLAWMMTDSHAAPATGLDKIQHIIVLSLENHSFDNLFGQFPGADGLSQGKRTLAQTDAQGAPYRFLPKVMDSDTSPPAPDTRFPAQLPNQPFSIDRYVPQNQKTGDLVHRFYQEQEQIDGGKMDHFALISNAGALTMGTYDADKTELWQLARQYTLADHFFHAAFGGSFLNHFWLVCACTPVFPHAPDALVARLDAQGNRLKDGAVTPDFYAVNTLYSVNIPHPDKVDAANLLPAQELPTIGDRLSKKHIGWAWYSGGWKDAINGRPDPTFQYHHQPFAYFKNYAEGTAARAEHLRDEADLLRDLKDDTLPAVVFYKPLGEFNLHPGYANITSGDAHVAQLVQAIMHSPAWGSSVVIITFDENGGFWDHVPPPVADRWGPGVRVPALILSPFARRQYIDHTIYDTTSILRFIEKRFALQPLGPRDAQANEFSGALAFE